jgi:hypothetical protein
LARDLSHLFVVEVEAVAVDEMAEGEADPKMVHIILQVEIISIIMSNSTEDVGTVEEAVEEVDTLAEDAEENDIHIRATITNSMEPVSIVEATVIVPMYAPARREDLHIIILFRRIPTTTIMIMMKQIMRLMFGNIMKREHLRILMMLLAWFPIV